MLSPGLYRVLFTFAIVWHGVEVDLQSLLSLPDGEK
jgi:hypothetical protein